MVTQVLARSQQPLILLIFTGIHPKGSLADFRCQDGVLFSFPYSPRFPFIGKAVPYRHATLTEIYPFLAVALLTIQLTHPLTGQLRILYFFQPPGSCIGQPQLEGLCFRRWNRLDKAKYTLCICGKCATFLSRLGFHCYLGTICP